MVFLTSSIQDFDKMTNTSTNIEKHTITPDSGTETMKPSVKRYVVGKHENGLTAAEVDKLTSKNHVQKDQV